MDIGDIVIFGGKRYRIAGFDPAGVEPRCVYLRDVRTGQTVSLGYEVLEPAGSGGASAPDESSTDRSEPS
jgi:hypothetical protein